MEGWAVRREWTPGTNVTLYPRYLDAFYFAVTTLTTVGFGDRTPTSNAEILFAILAELFGEKRSSFGSVLGSCSPA